MSVLQSEGRTEAGSPKAQKDTGGGDIDAMEKIDDGSRVCVQTFKPDDCQPGLVCILADHKLTSERRTSRWRIWNTRNLCQVFERRYRRSSTRIAKTNRKASVPIYDTEAMISPSIIRTCTMR